MSDRETLIIGAILLSLGTVIVSYFVWKGEAIEREEKGLGERIRKQEARSQLLVTEPKEGFGKKAWKFERRKGA